MVCTFAFITLTWVFFRAQSLGDAVIVLRHIAGDALDVNAWLDLGRRFAQDRSWLKTAGMVAAFVLVEWVQRRQHHALARLPGHRAVRWVIYTVLIWSTLFWGTHFGTQFIYFQF